MAWKVDRLEPVVAMPQNEKSDLWKTLAEPRNVARAVGMASIVFGVVDSLYGRRFGKVIGAEDAGEPLFRAVGAREIATGVAAIAAPTHPAPLWTRFGADLLDLAALGVVAAKRDNPKRGAAIATFALVAGVALGDYLAARYVQRAASS